MQFSKGTKRIDKKTYLTRDTSKCNTQWEVLLSKQVNYNQVVVKCQILQECFLQNFNMQKFQNMEHSNSMTFQGLLKDPMNPVNNNNKKIIIIKQHQKPQTETTYNNVSTSQL